MHVEVLVALANEELRVRSNTQKPNEETKESKWLLYEMGVEMWWWWWCSPPVARRGCMRTRGKHWNGDGKSCRFVFIGTHKVKKTMVKVYE